jgi:hypothetical protein
VKLDGLRAGDVHGVGSASRRRLDLHLPAVVGSSNAGCAMTADLDTNRLAGVSPAPDRVRLAALQDHVVTKNWADKWGRLVRRGQLRKTGKILGKKGASGRDQ